MSNNFGHQLLDLSLLVGIVTPWVALAQVPVNNIGSDSVEDRVTQLECIPNAHSQSLTQLQQQFSDNQSDIDSLRGQIQKNRYQLNQVTGRQKQVLLQIDSPSNGGATAQSTSSDQSGTAASMMPTADAGTTNAGAPVKSGGANMGCNTAITLVQDKSCQDDVMVAFQNFIKNYPDSTYLPDVNYWLGQLNYNKDERDDAAYYFASIMKNYPKLPKAVGTMFKVGIIIQNKGDTAKAKAAYQQAIGRYPGINGTKRARKYLNAM